MARSLPNVHPLIGEPLEEPRVSKLDLSHTNPALSKIDLSNNKEFGAYIFDGTIRIGGYLEQRAMYAKSELFEGAEPRNIHLGVDIWTPPRQPIFAPLSGVVTGVGDNSGYGNYGPTLVVRHSWEDRSIFALYGHLGADVLAKWKVGDEVTSGQPLAQVGEEHENGNWPPHLHFQLIRTMEVGAFDFPGVCTPTELAKYRKICPDPNLILRSPILEPFNSEL